MSPPRHHCFTLPEVRLWSGVQTKLVDPLKGQGKRVEGLSVDVYGRFRYVIDDEKIRLREGRRAGGWQGPLGPAVGAYAGGQAQSQRPRRLPECRPKGSAGYLSIEIS